MCQRVEKFGGRFDLSWTGGGTPATRLSDWLDPANSNQLTTNTTNVFALTHFNPTLSISGPTLICNNAQYVIPNLPTGADVIWTIPSSGGSVLLLSPNTPGPNELEITNRKWYSVITTLTAEISDLGCGVPNQTRTMTIANDNYPSSTPYVYFQEACTINNIWYPSQSGSVISNSSPTFVRQGCMVYVNLGDMTGRTVTLGGGGTPTVWGVGSTSYYPNTLYFKLPLGSGGIPFTFNINGNAACFQRSLLFFAYNSTSNFSYAISPNPVNSQLILTIKANEDYPKDNSSKWEQDKSIINIFDLNKGKIHLTQQLQPDNMHQPINVSSLKAGYYILQIINGKDIQSLKFLKE